MNGMDEEDRKVAKLLKRAGTIPSEDPATIAAFIARLQRVPDEHPQRMAAARRRSVLAALFDMLPRPWILAEGGALAAALCLGLVIGYDDGFFGSSENLVDLDLSNSLIAGTGDLDYYEEGTL